MKFENIEKIHSSLSNFKEEDMPIRLSYKFTLLFDKIDYEYKFYLSELKKIIHKYGLKNEQGDFIQENGNIKINPDFVGLAEKALQELHETEFATPTIIFTLDELETLNIKPADLHALLPFIKED